VKKLTVESLPHPSGLVIRISGEAGVDNVESLANDLMKFSAGKPKLVVFDLSGLDFIASMGMGVLMAFRQELARSGGIVRVAAARPMVLDAFKRACLNALFNTCASVDEALKK